LEGNFTKTYNEINETLTTMQDFSKDVEGGVEEAESSAIESLTTMWAVIKLPIKTLSTVRHLITESSTIIGVPTWFSYSVLSIIIVSIALMVVAILFRRTRT
jgi:uncharacterized membrane protein YhdT